MHDKQRMIWIANVVSHSDMQLPDVIQTIANQYCSSISGLMVVDIMCTYINMKHVVYMLNCYAYT